MARELPVTLYSPEQLKVCTFEMEALVAWRRRQDIKDRTKVRVQAMPEFSIGPELTGLLGPPEQVATLSTVQMEQWQQQLELWLKQPVVHITFATPPPPATKLAMVRWFRTEILATVLIKFEVNRNIVGGMVVRTPSRIFDLSFRRPLVDNKSLIPEILKRV